MKILAITFSLNSSIFLFLAPMIPLERCAKKKGKRGFRDFFQLGSLRNKTWQVRVFLYSIKSSLEVSQKRNHLGNGSDFPATSFTIFRMKKIVCVFRGPFYSSFIARHKNKKRWKRGRGKKRFSCTLSCLVQKIWQQKPKYNGMSIFNLILDL